MKQSNEEQHNQLYNLDDNNKGAYLNKSSNAKSESIVLPNMIKNKSLTSPTSKKNSKPYYCSHVARTMYMSKNDATGSSQMTPENNKINITSDVVHHHHHHHFHHHHHRSSSTVISCIVPCFKGKRNSSDALPSTMTRRNSTTKPIVQEIVEEGLFIPSVRTHEDINTIQEETSLLEDSDIIKTPVKQIIKKQRRDSVENGVSVNMIANRDIYNNDELFASSETFLNASDSLLFQVPPTLNDMYRMIDEDLLRKKRSPYVA